MDKERRIVTPGEAAGRGGVKVPVLTTKEALMGLLDDEVSFASTASVMAGEHGVHVEGMSNMEVFRRAGLTRGELLPASLMAFRVILIELAVKLRGDGIVAIVEDETIKEGEDAEADAK